MAIGFQTPPFDPRMTGNGFQQRNLPLNASGIPQLQGGQVQRAGTSVQQAPLSATGPISGQTQMQTTTALPPPQFRQQQPPQQQGQTQFGLQGAEAAQQAGLEGALGASQQGTGQALDTLLFGNQLAQGQLNQGQQALGGNFGAQAQQANVVNVDPLTGQPLFQQAAGGVGQFVGAGVNAQNLQSALSGAQGQGAFDAATVDNPFLNFLNQRGQEALVNQQAASGGLGSGQFQAELQQLGQAQAGGQLQQQIQNLGALSGQGLQAAGQQGQFLSQAGQQQGNLAAQNAQLGTNVNLQNAQLGTQAGLQSAGNRLSAAQSQAGLFGQGAGISANLAGQGAAFQQQGGLTAANLFSNTGQNVAQNRFQAGRDIAGQVGSTTSALANLQNQQGTGFSDILGQGAANQANLLSSFGQLSAQQQQQLMVQLGNISLGQGFELADGAGAIGQAQAGGIAGAAGQQQQTALQLATLFSDKRLKDDIVKVGIKNGHNIYKWVWNNLMPIKSQIGKSSTGVIAQEVEKIKPEAISQHESGYKQVNYAMIGVL